MPHAAVCPEAAAARALHHPMRRSGRPRPASLVRATLWRNGADELRHDPLVEVPLASPSRIVRVNGSRVWCARYPGLGGLFRKDRGPSKELGRALCDEMKRAFGCDGFLTSDELPRYGIGRSARRAIMAAAGASAADCVVVYAYSEGLAAEMDGRLFARLDAMV